MEAAPRFGLVLVAADDYGDPPGSLPSSKSADRLARLLIGERGGRLVQRVVAGTAREVRAALRGWAAHRDDSPQSSFVYLVGHGRTDGDFHWFIAPENADEPDGENEIRTQGISEMIRSDWAVRQQAEPSSWSVIVLDCCASDVGVANLVHALSAPAARKPRRLGLWPVTPQGASHSGRFVDILERCLGTFTENDEEIALQELIRRISPELGDLEPEGLLPAAAALVNPLRAAGAVTINVDAYAELRRVIGTLPAPVRSHFLVKAQGAEIGDLAWYFTGRESEVATLSSWLQAAASGMRVVTGEAGSGKSAALGYLVVLADDDLVDALVGSKLIASPHGRPPSAVFDAVVHLTGKTLAECVREIGNSSKVSAAIPDASGLTLDQLLAALGSLQTRLTILVDALDEAQEPLQIADFLRLAARAPTVRVLVGTRGSLSEGPDIAPQPARPELLDALGANDEQLVVISRDVAATAQYVTRRLMADGSPYAADQQRAAALAQAISQLDQPFLFAHLAVAELVARPTLHPNDTALRTLLAGGHRGLFAAAVGRLGAQDPTLVALLQALALARGRGLPEAAGIWVDVARALFPGMPIQDAAVRTALDKAAPYITLDGEAGQSTYRLAHQTYVEYFRASPAAPGRGHREVARSLEALVERTGGWLAANYYSARYLPEHLVADADRVTPDVEGLTALATNSAWLARSLSLLGIDRLVEVLTAAHRVTPTPVVDTVARALRRSRIALAQDPTQLAAQLHARLKDTDDSALRSLVDTLDHAAPGRWLRLRTPAIAWQADLDTTYTAPGTVRALAFGAIGEQTVLAIGVDDEVVIWDPRRGSQDLRTIPNDRLEVTALALTELSGRSTVVVAAHTRIVLRDARSGDQVGEEFHAYEYVDSVAVGLLGDRVVVAASGNGWVWVWDATTAERIPIPEEIVHHVGTVDGVTTVEGRIAFRFLDRDGGGLLHLTVVDETGADLWSLMGLTSERPYGSAYGQAGSEPVLAMIVASRRMVDLCYPARPQNIVDPLHLSLGWQRVHGDPPENRHREVHLEFPEPLRVIAVGSIEGRALLASALDYEGSAFVSMKEFSAPPVSNSTQKLIIPHKSIFAWRAYTDHSVVALTGRTLLDVREQSFSGDRPIETIHYPSPDEVATFFAGNAAGLRFSLLDANDRTHRLLDARDMGKRPVGWSPRKAGLRLTRDNPLEWPATAKSWGVVGGRAAMAMGSYAGAVWIWDLDAKTVIAGPFAEIPDEMVLPGSREGRLPEVTSITLGQVAGRDVVATVCAGKVSMWDVHDTDAPKMPALGAIVVKTVALGALAGHSVLITGSQGGVLDVWDTRSGERLAGMTLDAPLKEVWVVRDADMVAALTTEDDLNLFDFHTGHMSPEA
jgi:hypothetical protein